jgi:hypothetical protein
LLPKGILSFDFSGFDSVTVESCYDGEIVRCAHHEFHELHFDYSNLREKYKVNYCFLKPGDYIYVSEGGVPSVGKFLTIVWTSSGEHPYIAYTKPRATRINDDFLFTSHSVSSCETNELYLVPPSNFLERVYTYASTADAYDLVL